MVIGRKSLQYLPALDRLPIADTVSRDKFNSWLKIGLSGKKLLLLIGLILSVVTQNYHLGRS